MTAIKTPVQMLEHWEATFPDQTYLRQSDGTGWTDYSWSVIADQVRRLAAYIHRQDYPAGSRIAIWSANSVDWVVADLAIMMSGHISVPLYPAQDLENAEYILQHSEAVMLFAGQFEQAAKLQQILPPGTQTVAMAGSTVPCDDSVADILARTEPKRDFPPRSLEDIFSIIYSSGTSGRPKGVMLTFGAVSQTLPFLTGEYGRPVCAEPGDDRERVISYLPMSHAAERSLVVIASLYLNSCVSISSGLEHFGREILDVRPTMFGAVPRIWYKFMQGIEAALKAQGKRIETEEDKAMVRTMLGLDQVKSIVTGSAPASPAVHNWYSNLGLYLRESYGSTETFAYGTIWEANKPPISGCIGKPVQGIELKLDDKGEIFLRSPVLMKGYYKNEEKTAETLVDGWYATGDLGRIDEQGNLWLTGRVGSIFKTSKGKFINPERLERDLQKLLVVDQIMVFGHGLAQPVAVANIAEASIGKSDEEILGYFENGIERVNAELPPYERIHALLLVRDAWTVDSGQLTPTLKIKRNVLQVQYGEKLEAAQSGIVLESTRSR